MSVMLRVDISYVNFAAMIGIVTFMCTYRWQRNRASLQLIDHSDPLVRLGCICICCRVLLLCCWYSFVVSFC